MGCTVQCAVVPLQLFLFLAPPSGQYKLLSVVQLVVEPSVFSVPFSAYRKPQRRSFLMNTRLTMPSRTSPPQHRRLPPPKRSNPPLPMRRPWLHLRPTQERPSPRTRPISCVSRRFRSRPLLQNPARSRSGTLIINVRLPPG